MVMVKYSWRLEDIASLDFINSLVLVAVRLSGAVVDIELEYEQEITREILIQAGVGRDGERQGQLKPNTAHVTINTDASRR
jgi:hypothetical protein